MIKHEKKNNTNMFKYIDKVRINLWCSLNSNKKISKKDTGQLSTPEETKVWRDKESYIPLSQCQECWQC